MSFIAQSGHIGFKAQSTKGTYANPGSGGIFMRHKSGALGGDRQLLIPDPEIGGGRDVADASLGPVKFSGELEFYARLESLASLFYYGSGSKSSTTAGSGGTLVGTHVITPTDTNLPWVSVEERIANGFLGFNYTDAKVRSLHLEADASGFVMGKVGMVALRQTRVADGSLTSNPSRDNSPLLVGAKTTVSFDGDALPAKSFSLDIENGVEDDDFRLGSMFLGDAAEKRRTGKIGLSIRPEDNAMWRQAMYGSPSANTAGGTITRSDVSIAIESYEFIGSTSTVYSLTIDVPVAVIAPFSVNPSGEDAIEHDIEIQFLRPDANDPLYTATFVNHLAAVV